MVAAAIAQRQGQPLDVLQAGVAGGGWDALEQLLLPPEHRAAFEPSDDLARFVYGLSRTVDGREFIEYLMDITVRMPLRITGSSIEQTALMAATRQGINGVGEAVLNIIAKGEALAGNGKKQNGAQS